MWKKLRIAILITVMAMVVSRYFYDQQDLEWEQTLLVNLYPVNGDGSAQTNAYIESLRVSDFAPLERYFKDQSERFNVNLYQPFSVQLAPQIHDSLPILPMKPSMLDAIFWSLRMRVFAWRHGWSDVVPHIRLYLVYFDPDIYPALNHSLALSKGRLAQVNVFANRRQNDQNLVILSHELLHTVGATDKYDAKSGQPIFPDGYADPQQQPLYPQQRAELMGGRVAQTQSTAYIPHNLAATMIGVKTATEIRWTAQK